MPNYDFLCNLCQDTFEELMTFSEYSDYINTLKLIKCPKCGIEAKHKRLYSAALISFKGQGWTEKFHRDSTGSLKDASSLMKEEAKNVKSSEAYSSVMPKDNHQ
jgi:putative FmdB family regulatory protein